MTEPEHDTEALARRWLDLAGFREEVFDVGDGDPSVRFVAPTGHSLRLSLSRPWEFIGVVVEEMEHRRFTVESESWSEDGEQWHILGFVKDFRSEAASSNRHPAVLLAAIAALEGGTE